jgi:hypothetical protein
MGWAMESWRRQYLGLESVPAALTSAEIEFFFAPGEQARRLIGNRRRPLTRLGLILQIGFRVLGEHAARKLTAHLRRQATIQLDTRKNLPFWGQYIERAQIYG